MIMFEYQTPGILQLISRTGYKLVQENGQRIYGGPPPNWMGPPPPKGSEVFIGKLPRDIFEDTLVPIFERVGFIYEMRLMMDFSGTNRGFCFVTYSTPEEAARAVKELDRFPIRPNYRLGVTVSIDNCRLFIGGLPKDKNREEIFDEISRVTEGVVDVICYPGIADKSKSRGFAFVEYESHKAAAMARRKLLPQKILLFEQRVAVDWAEPEPMVSDEIMKNVRILYVRGLQLHTTEGNIRRFFESFSTGIEKVKKTKDFCFVHFETRAQAESAYNYIKCHDPAIIDNAVVEVAWSRPVNRTEYEARKELVRSISNGSLPGGPLPNLESITANCITRPDRGAAGLLSTKAGQDTVRRSMWLVECMQELMRVCEMHGWGVPTYQLLSNYPPAVDTPNRLYVYKVTIGDKEILATRLTLDKDDALDLAMLSTFEELATLPNGGAVLPYYYPNLTDPYARPPFSYPSYPSINPAKTFACEYNPLTPLQQFNYDAYATPWISNTGHMAQQQIGPQSMAPLAVPHYQDIGVFQHAVGKNYLQASGVNDLRPRALLHS